LWLGAFNQLLSASEETQPFSGDLYATISNFQGAKAVEDSLDDAYLARPVDWKLDKRRVYNYRRIQFRLPIEHASPVELVEHCLQLAFGLAGNALKESKWIEFLDSISLLQVISNINLCLILT